MAEYTNISLSDMDSALRSDKGWTRSVQGQSREYVYSYTLKGDSGVSIKVWSSIHVDGGNARGVGRDAIRVCAVRGDYGFIKSKRVHRVMGWRDNLRSRVMTVIRDAKERHERSSRSRPVADLPSITEEQREAGRWLSGYTGDFAFLRDMVSRLERLQALSERQWASVIRCMNREQRQPRRRRQQAIRERQEEQEPVLFGRSGELEEVEVEGDPWA